MIIFGTQGVTRAGESGEFACPGCGGTPQLYTRKTVRRFFTLYFIPVIPLGKLGEYIECQRCGGAFNDGVLDDHEGAREQSRAEFVGHVKRVMVLASLVDGRSTEAKFDAIRETYRALRGTTLSQLDIRQEITLARQAEGGGGMPAYARRFAGNLNEYGKEVVIRSAFAVLTADSGALDGEGLDSLAALAAAMDVSPTHLRGILAELND